MRRNNERGGTKGQVHAGAADSRGFTDVVWGDHPLGEVLWPEAARPAAAIQSSGGDCSGHAGCGDVTSGESIASPGDAGGDGTGDGGKRRGNKRIPRRRDRLRKKSLPRGTFGPRP